MSASSPSEPVFAARAAGFPKARQGYSRGHVDEFVADAQRYVDRLRQENAALAAEVSRLSGQLSDTEAKYERIRTADLDERAADVLAAAEEQARAMVADGQRLTEESLQRARREADVIFERGRQELAWRRRRLAAERAELERQLEYAQRTTDTARGQVSTLEPQGEGAPSATMAEDPTPVDQTREASVAPPSA